MSQGVFKVATYNCNSIRARLELVMEWLARQAPDVLCLQETKVPDDEFPSAEFHDRGYQVLFRGQKAHAGVALVTRAEAKQASFGLEDGAEPDETRLIRARVGDVWVVNTYVPQGRTVDSAFPVQTGMVGPFAELFRPAPQAAGPACLDGGFQRGTPGNRCIRSQTSGQTRGLSSRGPRGARASP